VLTNSATVQDISVSNLKLTYRGENIFPAVKKSFLYIHIHIGHIECRVCRYRGEINFPSCWTA
jgi:hypothetical protein